MRCLLKKSVTLLSAVLLWTTGAAAENFNTPTLQRIKETGKIRIGYGVTAPFSFLGPDGKIIGYSVDLCRELTEKLKKKLDIPVIEIEFVPRTPSNRVQLLNEGVMDIECNASTNNAERRKSAGFAISHFYGETRYVSLAKNELHTLADLKGRSVSVALGTVNVTDINDINRQRKLNMSVVPVDSLQAAFDMVKNGQVSAFAMDEVLLKTMIARSTNPADYAISTERVTGAQPFGFMMRVGDSEFISAVNEALSEIYKSPAMKDIYSRWFESPIPGIGVSLNLPMSNALREHFANPTAVQ